MAAIPGLGGGVPQGLNIPALIKWEPPSSSGPVLECSAYWSIFLQWLQFALIQVVENFEIENIYWGNCIHSAWVMDFSYVRGKLFLPSW